MTATLPDTTIMSLKDMIKTPGIYVVEISPADAVEMLTRNTGNRVMKSRAVQVYARAMKNGKWKLTNQGIGFDSQGQLVDGQNRLQACILAETPFTTLLVTGLDRTAREVVDTGVKRLFADVLRMNDYSNVHWLSAATATRYRYEFLVNEKRPFHQFNLLQMRGTHDELLAYVRDHPSLVTQLNPAGAIHRAFPAVPPSAAVAFESLIAETEDAEYLDEFRTSLISGADLSAGDPRLTLRNYLAKTEPGVKSGATSMFMLGVLIKVWNDWRQGETRSMIQMKDTEAMTAIGAPRRWKKVQAKSITQPAAP